MNITKFEREMLILERDVEKRFKRRVEKSVEGALCWKFVSPGQSGVPDRIVILPHGLMMWVELKRPGAEPRPTQMARFEQMDRAGHEVAVVRTFNEVDLYGVYIQDVVKAFEGLEPIPNLPESLSWRRFR